MNAWPSVATGLVALAGGLLLFLWYRTLAGLSVKLRPQFAGTPGFKWGVPPICLALFGAGLRLLGQAGVWYAAAALAGSGLLLYLVIRFDRYSARMRLILERYTEIRRSNPALSETEALYLTARWCYPSWSEDRLLELVAGKDIQTLILLILVRDNDVHPISDWELYRSLRTKAERITRAGG